MRSLFMVATACLLALPARSQTAKPENAQLACFEQLSIPEFPRAALQANVDGSVWATVQVTPQGAVDKIDTRVVSAYAAGTKLLVPGLEKVIRSAKNRSDCAGKTVTLVVRYQIDGEAVPNPQTMSRIQPPNIIWLESRPIEKSATTSTR